MSSSWLWADTPGSNAAAHFAACAWGLLGFRSLCMPRLPIPQAQVKAREGEKGELEVGCYCRCCGERLPPPPPTVRFGAQRPSPMTEGPREARRLGESDLGAGCQGEGGWAGSVGQGVACKRERCRPPNAPPRCGAR